MVLRVKPVAVNRPQNSQHASRKPVAVGWLTRAHSQQRARTRYWTRAHHTCDEPLLKVVHEQPANQQPRYQPMAATKSRCPSGEPACTRAKGKCDTAHSFVLSSAHSLR